MLLLSRPAHPGRHRRPRSHRRRPEEERGDDPALQVSDEVRRLGLVVLGGAALLVVATMVWLWPDEPVRVTEAGPGRHRVAAQVVGTTAADCPESATPPEAAAQQAPQNQQAQPGGGGGDIACDLVTVRIAEGPEAGREVRAALPAGPGATAVHEGDSVLVAREAADGTFRIVDHRRDTQLWVLGLAFALAVVAFGRWRGLTALIGLAATFAILFGFVVPAILGGRPPLLVAIAGAAAIMLTVLYLTHGFNVATSVAVVGTLASLTLTGVLAAVVTAAVQLTGVVDDDTKVLASVNPDVRMGGLLLAGILIGSLGVLDDVTVTQTASVSELAAADPTMSPAAIYRAAMRIGRLHVASVVNTIVLACAGASLPLLLLLTSDGRPAGEVVTDPAVAQEIVRSVVGTVGIMSAVPITTALATFLARGRVPTLPAPLAALLVRTNASKSRRHRVP